MGLDAHASSLYFYRSVNGIFYAMLPHFAQQSAVLSLVAAVFLARAAVCKPHLKKAGNASIDLATSQVLENPFPYYFPDQNDSANLFPMESCHSITLEEATIDQLQDYMSNGKLTASQLAMCYLQRQYQTDKYIKFVEAFSGVDSRPISSADWHAAVPSCSSIPTS